MKIEILGTGCEKCKKLYELTEGTVKELGMSVEIAKIENIDEIMKYKVMLTPALAIDGVIKSSGRIPTKAELTTWITSGMLK